MNPCAVAEGDSNTSMTTSGSTTAVLRTDGLSDMLSKYAILSASIGRGNIMFRDRMTVPDSLMFSHPTTSKAIVNGDKGFRGTKLGGRVSGGLSGGASFRLLGELWRFRWSCQATIRFKPRFFC